MKVQLISAQHELSGERGGELPKQRPPIGLEVIASVIESQVENVGIEILDGVIIPHEKILNSLDGDFVGLSSWFSNHRNALEIAKVAKEKGCTVVFGGPNATHLAKNILRNNPFIDYVIAGDGEYALTKLIKGYKPREIENLFYRAGDKIKFTYEEQVDVNKLPLFNLEHTIAYDKYFADEEEKNLFPFLISSIRGCIKALKGGRCSFCSLPTRGVRLLNPKKVWEQVRLLKEDYGFNYFFETGDNFIVGNYPEKLLKNRQNDLSEVTLRIFERPDSINEENAKILKKLNVKEIFIGAEHVDKEILKKANKLYNTDYIWKELEILEDYEIEVLLSVVFGLPGETLETAEKNYEFAKKVIDKYSNVSKLGVSIALPLAGSPLFNKLLSDKRILSEYAVYGRNLVNEDLPDYNLLTKLMIENYCNIGLSDLVEIIEKTKKLLPENKIGSCGNINLKLTSA